MTEPGVATTTDELVAAVVERESALAGDRLVVAVAGPPAAGKSSIAERLTRVLNSQSPGSAAVLPMDGYHYDDAVLEARGWRDRKGAPHTFDVAGFASMLGRLRANEEPEVAVPVFDRSIEIARSAARVIPQAAHYLVVEGNYLLLDEAPWDRLIDYFDLTVFVDVDDNEIRRRLERRWSEMDGEKRRRQIDGNDMPNVRLVKAQSRPADVVYRQST